MKIPDAIDDAPTTIERKVKDSLSPLG